MSNNRLRKSLRARNYCCPFAVLRLNRSLGTAGLAQFLAVDRKTIQRWKSKIKLGECRCEHAPKCMKKLRGGLG